MKTLLWHLVAGLLLAGCPEAPAERAGPVLESASRSASSTAEDVRADARGIGERSGSVEVLLKGVEFRQYQGNDLRFECRAERLALDPERELLQGQGGVEVILMDRLWGEADR